MIRLTICALVLLTSTSLSAGSGAECTRLSGPPTYPPPLLGDFGGNARYFGIQLDPGGREEIVLLSTTEEQLWQARRVIVDDPQTLRTEPITLFEDRTRDDEVRLLRTGDPNGDGKTDLLVVWDTRGLVDDVELYLQSGDGEFVKTWEISLGGNIPNAELGDFDGDGADELVLQDGRFGGQLFALYRYSDATSTFHTEKEFAERSPSSLQVLDVNSDGLDDLVLLDRPFPLYTVVTYFGNRALPLGSRFPQRVGSLPPAMAVRRGAPAEIVFFDRQGTSNPSVLVRVWRWNGLGWREHLSQVLPDGLHPFPLSRDVNGDGLKDLLFETGDFGNRRGGFVVYMARDGGAYERVAETAFSPELIDFLPIDEDEHLDALVQTDLGFVSRYLSDGAGSFVDEPQLWESPDSYHLSATGDLDADGDADLVVASRAFEHLEWLRSRGDGNFERVRLPDLPPNATRDVEIHDLDGDGHLDIAALVFVQQSVQDHALFVNWGDEYATYDEWQIAATGDRLGERVFVDLDGNGDLELLGFSYTGFDWRSGNVLNTYALDGRRYRLVDSDSRDTGFYSSSSPSFAAGDIDGDGHVDVVHWGYQDFSSYLFWRKGRGDGTLGEPALLFDEILAAHQKITLTDVDRDRDLDVVLVSSRRARVLGQDEGLLRLFSDEFLEGSAGSLTLVDLDGDGLLDVTNAAGGYTFDAWLADGTGSFLRHTPSFFFGSRSGQNLFLPSLRQSAGLDFVHLTAPFNKAEGIQTSYQRTPVATEDREPPRVDVLLLPEVSESGGFIPEFENQWRVAARVADDCTVPEIAEFGALVDAIDPDVTAHYRHAESTEFRFYESPSTGGQEVVLLGPDESAVRDRFASFLSRGRVDTNQNSYLELRLHDEWGRPARENGDDVVVTPDARSSHVWRFDDDGTLRAIVVRRPGGDIAFEATARDAAGRSTTARGLLTDAIAAYCEDHDEPATLCQS